VEYDCAVPSGLEKRTRGGEGEGFAVEEGGQRLRSFFLLGKKISSSSRQNITSAKGGADEATDYYYYTLISPFPHAREYSAFLL
jgi:hypothetical protein